MSKMELKFGSVDSSTPPSSGGNASTDSQPTPLSGGANPPKSINTVQNMQFGDITVDKQETNQDSNSSNTNSHNKNRRNMAFNNNRNGGGNNNKNHHHHHHNQNHHHQQHQHVAHPPPPPPPPQNASPQVPGAHLPPQGIPPQQQGMYAAYPPYMAQQYYAYNPYYMQPAYHHSPSISPQAAHAYPVQGRPPTGAPPPPANASSTTNQGGNTPQKAHTPIKLSDPLTHQPIDLSSARSSGKQSQASTPSSVPATIASPRPTSSPLPATSNTQLSSSPGKQSPSKQPAKTQEEASSIKNSFMAQIQLAAKQAQDKQKAEREAKEKAEREAKEKAEREAKEKAEKEAKEKAEQEAKEKLEREAKEKAERDAAAAAAAAAASASASSEQEQQESESVEDKTSTALSSINEQLKSVNAASKSAAYTERLMKAVAATRPTPQEVNNFAYPENVYAPALRCTPSKYKYDPQFLMQFQPVVQFPPKENWEETTKVIMAGKSGGQGGDKNYSKSFGSRSNSVRNAPSAMGSFGANGGAGFRMDRSVSGSMTGNGGFGGPGGMGNHKLNRMHSSSNLSGMGRRQGSKRRGGPGGDRSGSRKQQEEKEEEKPHVPPPPRSANAWVPRIRKKDEDASKDVPSEENRLDPETVQRKVKSLLNKMTLDNFDRISDQILVIAAQSKYERDGRTLRQVIELTFAKAIDEQHWSNMYAKFCRKLWRDVDPEIEDENIKDKDGNLVKGGQLFRKYLLNRCQEEFEKGWADKLPTNEDGSTITDPELMSDEYYAAVAAKRKGLGLIRFIGELFILELLSERIIHACITKLSSSEDASEETIESLCKLMTTTGKFLDASPKGQKWMDIYFDNMLAIQRRPGLPSRLKFMLMDVADLRSAKWVQSGADKGPKTIADIQEAATKKQAEDQARQQSQKRSGSGYRRNRDGDHSGGNNFTTMVGDMSKIGRIRSQGGNQTFGPSSLMNRELSGSGRRSGSGANTPSGSGTLSKDPSRSASQQSTNTPRGNMFDLLSGNDGNADEDKKEVSATTAAAASSTTSTESYDSNATKVDESVTDKN